MMPMGALEAMEAAVGLPVPMRGCATSAALACEKLTPASTSHSITAFSTPSSSRSL